MTMHLLGPAYTTTRTSQKRKKLSASQLAAYHRDWHDHNKHMRRIGSSEMSFDNYVLYRQGRLKPSLKGTKLPDYQVSDHRSRYPSYGDQVGHIPARAEKTYTGSLIKGVATMHKSNAVPIISDEQAIEVARMRRG
jgi:hypothetical protein